jgi:hypothetical protein
VVAYDDNKVVYLNATTSSLVILQQLNNPSSSALVGVTYILESIALVVARAGNVQKYILTNTSITFDLVLNTVGNLQAITFFPGSKSQGYISSTSNILSYFYYNGTQLVITKTLITASSDVT